jgi:hypothetical protein
MFLKFLDDLELQREAEAKLAAKKSFSPNKSAYWMTEANLMLHCNDSFGIFTQLIGLQHVTFTGRPALPILVFPGDLMSANWPRGREGELCPKRIR